MGDSTGSTLNPGVGGVVLRGDDPNRPGDEMPGTSSDDSDPTSER